MYEYIYPVYEYLLLVGINCNTFYHGYFLVIRSER